MMQVGWIDDVKAAHPLQPIRPTSTYQEKLLTTVIFSLLHLRYQSSCFDHDSERVKSIVVQSRKGYIVICGAMCCKVGHKGLRWFAAGDKHVYCFLTP